MNKEKRIVIKIGTGVLTRRDGIRLDEPVFVELARAVSALHADGWHAVVVSSGAVGAGLMEFGRNERPTGTAELQAFAAIGQARLMQTWRTHLQVRDLAGANSCSPTETLNRPTAANASPGPSTTCFRWEM